MRSQVFDHFCSDLHISNNCNAVTWPYFFYNDDIMRAMASQITSLAIVWSTVYSGADQKKTSKLRVIGLCAGKSPVTGEFSAPRASNAENVSIWWRHHIDTVYSIIHAQCFRMVCFVWVILWTHKGVYYQFAIFCSTAQPTLGQSYMTDKN